MKRASSKNTHRPINGPPGSTGYIARNPPPGTRFLVYWIVYLLSGFPTLAYALPEGGQIVSGSGTIDTSGSTLTVTQSSDKLVIEWQNFNIGANETVNFLQPSTLAQVLNQIVGQNPSLIQGSLTANGQVFIANPNGISIAPGANIDVAGLLATTLKINNQDFLNDLYKFSQDAGKPLASILNEGTIRASDFIALLAPAVENKGVVVANLGTLALASGTEATLDFVGDGLISFSLTQAVDGTVVDKDGNAIASRISNTGTLQANGGQVILTAKNASDIIKNVVNQTGIIEAKTVVEKDGKIFLSGGDLGNVNLSGTLDASGTEAGEKGGTIQVSGQSVTVDNGFVLARGNEAVGGNIALNGASWVSLGGTVDASGQSGGSVDVDAGGLSIAGPVLAKGTTGQGGSIDLYTLYKSWENTDALLDVSGASGGSIHHVAGQQITTSATYRAVGTNGVGGTIDVTAPALKFLSTQIDASGTDGALQVRLGGEYQGGKNLTQDELANASILSMTDATTVKADTTGAHGDGGTIIAWADQKAVVLGQFSARPGTESGAGGFVEVSSGDTLTFGGTAQTGVADRVGTLLLDPKNIVIADASFNQYSIIIGNNYASVNADGISALEGGDKFGTSVSVEGNRMAVGVLGDDRSGVPADSTDTGAVYLFTFADSNFGGATLQAIIGDNYTGGKNYDQNLDNGDHFGTGVSLAGNRLAVGAQNDDGSGNGCSGCGAVYLYTFTDGSFSGAALAATVGSGYGGAKDINQALEASDTFGRSVSLDGNRLAVGANQDDGSGNAKADSGAVYLYTFTDSSFSGGTLAATIGSGYTGGKNIDQPLDVSDQFGKDVSLDGNRLAVGAWSDAGNGNTCTNCGAVYLYTFTDSSFSGGALAATIGSGYSGGNNINVTVDTGDSFGSSVSLDGNRLAVGAINDSGPSNATTSAGAVYLFTFSDSSFGGGELRSILGNGYTGGNNMNLLSVGANYLLGGAVSLNGNGLAVGAIGGDAVYIFTFADDAFAGGQQAGQLGSGYSGAKNLNQSLDVSDNFGWSVSLDGNRLAVGAPLDDGVSNGTSGVGAVYLYTFTDSAFSGGALTATIGSGYTGGKNVNQSLEGNDQFGYSVTLDGNRLAVGANLDDGSANAVSNSGAVYLYTFTDSAFTGGALAAIIGSGYSGGKNVNRTLDASDLFGLSVSLDGNRLAVGATFDDGSGGACSDCGAVYLYTFTDSSFSGGALAANIGSGYTGGKNVNQALANGDRFGGAVSLDGNRLAVGAYLDDGNGNALTDSGAVYLYTFTDNVFNGGTLAATLGSGYTGGKNVNQSLEGSDQFGRSVSLEGNRLAVGASADDGSGNSGTDSGAVYLYTFSDTAFTGGEAVGVVGANYSGGKNITVGLDDSDQFGTSVSMDNGRLVVGAPFDDGSGNANTDSGTVYFFEFPDSADQFAGGEMQAIVGPGYSGGKSYNQSLDAGDAFGTSVALDGQMMAIGAEGDQGSGNPGTNRGAVYLYTFTDDKFGGAVLQGIVGSGYTGGKNINQALDDSDQFGKGVDLDANRLAVGADAGDGSGNGTNGSGEVYLYTFTDSTFSGGALAATLGSGYTGGKNIDLTAQLGTTDQFGRSVSLDGTRLAVGAFSDDGSGDSLADSGAVYLFTFADTAFSGGSLVATIGSGYTGGKNIDPTLAASDTFGQAVSLDGTRLAVSAGGDDGSSDTVSDAGAVYLYTFTDAAFSGGTLAGKIGSGYTGGKNVNQSLDSSDNFGVDLSLDGNRLAIGALNDDGVSNATADAGAVYLYTFTDSSFSGGALAATIGSGYTGSKDISPPLDTGDRFGHSVALEGKKLAVGADADDASTNAATDAGAVYLYTFTDSAFSGGAFQGIIGSGYSGGKNVSVSLNGADYFGVPISLDGNRLAVGIQRDDGVSNGNPNAGAVHLYTFQDSSFAGGTLQSIIGSGYTGGKNINLTLDTGDAFGDSVSLDGNRLAVGAVQDDGSGASGSLEKGAVYLYTFTDSAFANNGSATDGSGALQAVIGSGYATRSKDINVTLDDIDYFGGHVSLNGNRLAVSGEGDDGFGDGLANSGAVYLYTFTDSAFSGGTLAGIIGSGYTSGKSINQTLDAGDGFGHGLSLDGTRLSVGSQNDDGASDTCTDCGAVYLYTFTDSVFSGGALAATIGSGYTGGNNIDQSLDTTDRFGIGTSLDGNTLAVGSWYGDGSANSVADSGEVRIYTFSDSAFSGGVLAATIGAGYTGDQDIDVPLGSGDAFGFSVSLDNGRLAVGAFGDDGLNNGSSDTGAVYLFTLAGDSVRSAQYGIGAGSDVTITPTSITNILNSGTNLVLQANNDITVFSAISASNPFGDGGDFTFQAGRSIFVNANITTDNGALTLIANDNLANGVVDNQRDSGTAVITMASGTAIDTGTGTFTAEMRPGTGKTNSTAGAITLRTVSTGTASVQGTTSVVFSGNFTSTGTVTIDADTDTNGGSFTQSATTTLNTGNNNLSITASDLVVANISGASSGQIDAGTGNVSIFKSNSNAIELGTANISGAMSVLGIELENIFAQNLTFGGNATSITVDGMTAANTNNIAGTLTLNATTDNASVTFQNTASTFNTLAVNADQGMGLNVNVTTDTGNMTLEGDADNSADTGDAITIADGITLASAGSITLDATTGGISLAGVATFNANTGITINDNMTSSGTGAITIDTDLDNNGTGDFTLAAGKTLTSNNNNLSLILQNFNLNTAGTLNSGTGSVTIVHSTGSSIGLGDGATGTVAISSAELQNITATNLNLGNSATSSIDVEAITSVNSGNIGTLTLTSGGDISFTDTASTIAGNLVASATGDITQTASLAVSGTSSFTVNGTSTITLTQAANNFTGAVVFTSGNNVTLVDTNAIILGASTVTGTLTVSANTGITINDNFSTGGLTTLNADLDNNGTGDFTLASGKTLNTNNSALTITASDIVTHISGSAGVITTGTADATFIASNGRTIGLGTGTGDFVLTDTELDAISANTIIIGNSTAGAILVDGLTLGAKNLTLRTGSTINDTDDVGDAVVTTGTLNLEAGTHIGNLTAEGFNIDAGTLGFSMGTTSDLILAHSNASATNRVFGFTGLHEGNVSFTLKQGNLLLDSVYTTGNVILAATAGSILDNNANGAGDNVRAVTATLNALTDIGDDGNPLEINVATLNASTTNAAPDSGIYLNEVDAIDLNNVTTVNGDITIEAGGPVTLTTVTAGGTGLARVIDRDIQAKQAAFAAQKQEVLDAAQSTFMTELSSILEAATKGGC